MPWLLGDIDDECKSIQNIQKFGLGGGKGPDFFDDEV